MNEEEKENPPTILIKDPGKGGVIGLLTWMEEGGVLKLVLSSDDGTAYVFAPEKTIGGP
jgi:hypothetical protein